jgi:hypothetical protein
MNPALEDYLRQWHHLYQQAVVSCSLTHQSWTVKQVLEHLGQTHKLQQLQTQQQLLQRSHEMARVPIIGVLGQLNSGKSTVVASFLSLHGRKRLPRGLSHKEGTHRFVYWCPQQWQQDPQRQRILRELLRQAHGNEPELLDDDPARAAEQYRSGLDQPHLLPIPLLAYDPGLSDSAFLDAPDIQTPDPLQWRPNVSSGIVNQRLAFVAQAAKVCSAFLFVWERSNIRDRLLSEYVDAIRQIMSAVPLYFLINKVRPQADALIDLLHDRDVQEIRNKQITDIYVAMDFDIAHWESMTPVGLVKACAGGEKQPAFFRLDESTAADPQQAPPSKWLPHLLHHLPTAPLQQHVVTSHLADFQRQLQELIDIVNSWMHQCRRHTENSYHGLLQFCHELFQDSQGEPLQIFDRQFNERLNKKIIETGPRYLRWADTIHGLVRSSLNQLNRFNPFARLHNKYSELKDHWQQLTENFVDVNELARRCAQQRWIPTDWSHEHLEDIWRAVLDRLQQYQYEAPEQQLQLMAEDFWRNIPPQTYRHSAWKCAITLAGSAAAVAGLVTAAVDGGATLLASYSMTGALSTVLPGTATLAVGALGAGSVLLTFREGLVQHNTLPYLSNFFALACDAFGLPRRLPEQPLMVRFGRGAQIRWYQLLQPTVKALPPVHCLPGTGLWEWTSAGQALQRLAQTHPICQSATAPTC